MEKNIRITIFHCSFVYSGGGERIVLEEAIGLKRRGYDVKVYAPTVDRKKCYPEFLKELGVKPILPSFFDKLPYRNAIRMVATSLLAPFLAFFFRNTNVFVGANQPGAWLAFCMAKVLRKPYIVYLNQPNRIVYPRPVDVEFGWYTTEKDYHVLYKLFGFAKPVLAVLDRCSISNADRILVNGKYIGDIIQNVYSVRTIDAPAGSNYQPIKNLNLTAKGIYKGKVKAGNTFIKKPYLLITNRHDPQKRFDYVVRALELVIKKHKNAKLVIPGPFTEHTKKLKSLAKELNIENKVYFTGQVSESDLQKLYKNATVYCYPSPQEDFGLGPLEAGGWGVPTVAWNHGGPTVTVENGITGFLVCPYKVKDYAKKILILLENRELRIRMGKKAWERTKNNFSWQKHLDILEKTIELVNNNLTKVNKGR